MLFNRIIYGHEDTSLNDSILLANISIHIQGNTKVNNLL